MIALNDRNNKRIYVMSLRISVESEMNWILGDIDFVSQMIDTIVISADMTVIVPPIVIRLPLSNYNDFRNRVPDPEDRGLSAMTMISESHISVHTWVNLGLCYVELASCKNFSCSEIQEAIEAYFNRYCKPNKFMVEDVKSLVI